jgi:hypothetical protein
VICIIEQHLQKSLKISTTLPRPCGLVIFERNLTAMLDQAPTQIEPKIMPIDQIEFVKELYPRFREDDAAIERCRAALDRLPPIIVARGRILTDGFHRWQAHRREGATKIAAIDLGNLADAEILEQSYRRNASHGQQLSKDEKIAAACHLYFSLGGTEAERYATIADILSLRRRPLCRQRHDHRHRQGDGPPRLGKRPRTQHTDLAHPRARHHGGVAGQCTEKS